MTDHNVLSHITTLSGMAEELRNLGAPVSEQQLVMRTVYTLPPSFRNFQSSWMDVPPAEQSMQRLTNRLLSEEVLVKVLNGGVTDPADIAFFAAGSRPAMWAAAVSAHVSAPVAMREDSAYVSNGYHGFRGRSGRGGRGRGPGNLNNRRDCNRQYGGSHSIICYNCDNPGHKSYNCPLKKIEDRRQQLSDEHNKNRKSFNV